MGDEKREWAISETYFWKFKRGQNSKRRNKPKRRTMIAELSLENPPKQFHFEYWIGSNRRLADAIVSRTGSYLRKDLRFLLRQIGSNWHSDSDGPSVK